MFLYRSLPSDCKSPNLNPDHIANSSVAVFDTSVSIADTSGSTPEVDSTVPELDSAMSSPDVSSCHSLPEDALEAMSLSTAAQRPPRLADPCTGPPGRSGSSCGRKQSHTLNPPAGDRHEGRTDVHTDFKQRSCGMGGGEGTYGPL